MAAATFISGTGSTSSSLIARVQAHDADAWRRFVELYSPLVYFWCRRAGLQPSDAADVLQDTFQSVASGIGAFQHGGPGHSFRAWLWTIARNKLRDYFRRRNVQPQSLGGSGADEQLQKLIADDDASESLPASASPLFARALQLVRAEFEDRTWDAFWRATVDGQPTEQVAADLGLSTNAVYKAKSRVLARLRRELGDWFGQP
jgi:RNA polymerase sigma-70 factor (ECF subfamily)